MPNLEPMLPKLRKVLYSALYRIKIAEGHVGKLIAAIAIVSYLGFLVISWSARPLKRADRLLKTGRLEFKDFIICEYVIAIDGCKYYCRRGFDEPYFAGNEEADVLPLAASLLRGGDTFIDVGCNVGYYSIPMGKLVGKRGNVVAIDVNAEVVNLLRKNARANGLDNIMAFNVAVSDRDGYATFYMAPHTTAGSLRKHPMLPVADSVTVRTSTLDKLLDSLAMKGEIQLTKIDIEGGEVDCLNGAKKSLERTRNILIECHGEPNRIKVERIVRETFMVEEVKKVRERNISYLWCARKARRCGGEVR